MTKEYDCAYTFNEPTVSKAYDCAYEITDDVISGVETIGFREIKGCKDGLYCHLKYTDQSCGTSAPADIAVGQTIYGSCSPMNSSYTGCTVSVDQTNVLEAITPCPSDQYCHLKYKDESCTSAGAEISGAVHGVCLPMNSSSAVCPPPTQK